jgi:hypothetical protein
MILRRKVPPTRRLSVIDRLIFVWLYRLRPSVVDAVSIVRPRSSCGGTDEVPPILAMGAASDGSGGSRGFLRFAGASYMTGHYIGINGGMAMLEPNMRMRRASPGQL